MFTKKLLTVTALCSMVAMASANAAESNHSATVSNTLKKAFLEDSTHYLKFRYRLEHLEDDNFTQDATASTLRSTLGYKTGNFYNFSATLEFQDVTALGDDNFNDTINGKTTRPIIADPNQTDVNLAYLTFSGIPDTNISIGRQRYNFDNKRFVNENNWRQRHQTFDSISAVNTSLPDTKITYVYANQLNTSNGSEHPTGNREVDFHLVNTKYSGWKYGSLSAYAYLLDYNDSALVGNSSSTYGARFTGNAPLNESMKLLYTAEYATQSDYADNTANFDANYYHGVLGIGGKNWSIKGAYEVLGADGTNGRFTAPLGTGHGFHGWADKFITIPANGIEDKNIKLSYKVQAPAYQLIDGLKFDARYHQFDAEQGGADYGSEVDLKISKKFLDGYSASLSYASYNADTFSKDKDKIAFMLGANF